MLSDDETLHTLRQALQLSPQNQPLRQHLVSVLCEVGRFEEAAVELRTLMTGDPENIALRLELAGCYSAAGKASHALVVLEALREANKLPAKGWLQLARLLIVEGAWEKAREAYRSALERDLTIADPGLAEKLGLSNGIPTAREPEAEREAQAVAEDGENGDGSRPHVIPTARSRQAAADSKGKWNLERPTLRFADVGGLEQLKEEISMKILQPAKTPELFAAYGKKSGGGILMYGPPGCGKTLLARATAGELEGRFMAVGIQDVLEMWIGSSERNLHALFEEARRAAPCVLFFDEVDALASKRSDHHGASGRSIVNQFLSELDGANASNEGVLMLGATNAPWHLDSAFRRPGRFDRVLFVPPPDELARVAALKVHLAGKPQEDLQLEAVARKTEGFSGADLKALVDLVIEDKLREALRTGHPAPIRGKDLLGCIKRVAPSTREWFASARNYALFSNQGGAYDDLVRYMKL
ncbi:MAG TPA: ATP-binding protein [Planctomycetota bacterium]|nr:ATP-binding protein [Planctomycetota bacterium]